jgi:hypothetical protein
MFLSDWHLVDDVPEFGVEVGGPAAEAAVVAIRLFVNGDLELQLMLPNSFSLVTNDEAKWATAFVLGKPFQNSKITDMNYTRF